MAAANTMKAPPGFAPVGINSSLYTPPNVNQVDLAKSNAPSLVVLCSWMGASPKNITKYATGYQKLLPHASILLIQSDILDMTWRSFATQEHNILPTVKFVESFLAAYRSTHTAEGGTFTAINSPIVLHIFSHGGSNSALRLLHGLENSPSPNTPTPLLLRAFILDSTPGNDSYQRAAHAASVGVPKSGLLHWTGLLAIHFTLCVMIPMAWVGLTLGIKHLRAALLDKKLLAADTPRLYLYSKADAMVDCHVVAEHAAEARRQGYKVDERRFESSPHCGHIIEDEQGYWKRVKDLMGV